MITNVKMKIIVYEIYYYKEYYQRIYIYFLYIYMCVCVFYLYVTLLLNDIYLLFFSFYLFYFYFKNNIIECLIYISKLVFLFVLLYIYKDVSTSLINKHNTYMCYKI